MNDSWQYLSVSFSYFKISCHQVFMSLKSFQNDTVQDLQVVVSHRSERVSKSDSRGSFNF